MRRLLPLLLLCAACGDDATAPVGSPCDPRLDPSSQCVGGSDARCFSPGVSCNPGFCSQACDTHACPKGANCVALSRLNPDTAQPEILNRCFIPCGVPDDCNQFGPMRCDPVYGVCAAPDFFSNFGTTGAKKPDGTACVAPAPAPTDPPRLVGANVLASDPSELDPEEVSVAVDATRGRVYVAYNGAGFPVSASGDGRTFRAAYDIDPTNAGDPQVATDATGRVYFAHLAFPQLVCQPGAGLPGGDAVHLEWTDDQGASWSPSHDVTPHDFENPSFFVDKPWLAVGPDGDVYLSFTVFSTASELASNDVHLVASHDRGQTWRDTIINETTPDRAHGRSLVMLTTDAAGLLYATWWEDPGDPSATGGFIYTARSSDRGASFGANVRVNPTPDAAFLDPAIAPSADGALVYVVYDRVVPGAALDAYDVVGTVAMGGGPFAAPVVVNDDASCASHFLPTAAVDAAGNLYVVWYDNRYGDGRVMWSRALRPAVGAPLVFSPNGQVTDASFAFTTTRNVHFLGDYLALAIAGGKVYAGWADLRNAGMATQTGRIDSQIYFGSGPVPP